MTVYAQLILNAIGSGLRLRAPHDINEPYSLVDNYSDFGKPEHDKYWQRSFIKPTIGPLDRDAALEVLATGLLTPLTENQINQRMGWRQLGIDGDKANIYVFIQ